MKKETKQLSLDQEKARKLYFKNWRDTHKDNIKKHNTTFWEKKAKELKETPLKSK